MDNNIKDGGTVDAASEATEALATAPLIPGKPKTKENPPKNEPEGDQETRKPKKRDVGSEKAAGVLGRGAGEFFTRLDMPVSPVVSEGVEELGKVALEEADGINSTWLKVAVIVVGIGLAITPPILVATGVMKDRNPPPKEQGGEST